jgi:elongation factor G
MEFSHYAACPNNVSEIVIKEAKEREEEKKK